MNQSTTGLLIVDLEKMMAKCDTDNSNIDAILASLRLPEEDTIALQYLHLRHTTYEDLGEELGYAVAYQNLDDLFAGIRQESPQVHRQRYQRARGVPFQEESSRVQLKLVKDAAFQGRVFDIYRNQVWPILKQDIA